MRQKINWSVNAAVGDGPRLSASQTIGVAAYDKVRAVVDKKDTTADLPGTTTVEVQPSGQAGAVRFFAVTSDRYGKDLSFTVVSGGVADVALEGPLVLVGEGIDALLQKAPKKLKFSNGTAEDVTVEIVVGREA